MKKFAKLLFVSFLTLALAPAVVGSLKSNRKATQVKADPEQIVECNDFAEFYDAMTNPNVKKVQLNEISGNEGKIDKSVGSGFASAINISSEKELILNGTARFIDVPKEGYKVYGSLLQVNSGGSLKIVGEGDLIFMPYNMDSSFDNSVIRNNGGTIVVDSSTVHIIGNTTYSTYCRALTHGGGTLTIKDGNFDGMFADKYATSSKKSGAILLYNGTFNILDGNFDYSESNGDSSKKASVMIMNATGSISGGFFSRIFVDNGHHLSEYIDPVCRVHNNLKGYATESNMDELAADYPFKVEKPHYTITNVSSYFECKFGTQCRVDYTLNFEPDYVELYQKVEGEWVLAQDDFGPSFGYVNGVSYGGVNNRDRIYYSIRAVKNSSFGQLYVSKEFIIDWTNSVVKLYPGEGEGNIITTYPNMSTHKLVLPECTFTAPANQVFNKWRIGTNYYNVGEEVTILNDTNIFATYRAPSNSFVVQPVSTVLSFDQLEHIIEFKGDFYNPIYKLEIFSGEWSDSNTPTYQNCEKFRIFGNFEGETRTYRISAYNAETNAPLGSSDIFSVSWKNKDDIVVYSLTYHAGEASGLPGNTAIIYNNLPEGEDVYVESCSFTAPDDKTFVGWAVNDPYELPSKDPNDKIQINGNIILYAIYDDGFDLTISSGESASANINLEHLYGDFELPDCSFDAPNGKRFAYWETDFGNLFPGDIINIAGPTEIVAIYEDILYTVSFKSNGGDGEMSPSVGISNNYTIPECTFSAPAHCVFSGWAKGSPDSVDFYPHDFEGTVDITEDTIFYAVWTNILHTVTYNAGEATSVEGNTNIVFEELNEGSYISLLNGLTYKPAAGKVFKGWALNSPTGQLLQPNSAFELLADTTFYAVWENEHIVNISFNGNGGVGAMEALSLKSGVYVIPVCKFTAPEGKEFSCWEIGTTQYDENDVILVNEDCVIKAIWKDIQTVTPTTPDTPTTPESQTKKPGLSGGAIAGIVIGSTLVLAVGGFSVFWFVIKKKSFADLLAIFKKK